METDPLIGLKELALIGIGLLVAGVFAGLKLPGKRRLWLILPIAVFGGACVHVALGVRQERRQADGIFAALDAPAELTAQDVEALQALARSPGRVRERVLRIAFANPTNAAVALPRIDFLLQAHLRLDPDGEKRQKLWQKIVEPSLKGRPSNEVLLLAAATADSLDPGTNELHRVTGPLLVALQGATDLQARAMMADQVVSLASRLPRDDAIPAAKLLVREIQSHTATNDARSNPAAAHRRIGVLAKGLSTLLDRAEPGPTEAVMEPLVTVLETETNLYRFASLANGLSGAGDRITTGQADRLARALVRAMKDGDAHSVAGLADSMAPLASRLTSEQAEPIAEQIITQMGRVGDLFRLRPLVGGLNPLVSRLDPDANSRSVQRIVTVMIRQASQEGLRQFSNVLTSMVDRVSSETALPLADQLLDRTLPEPNYVTRAPLVAAFATLAGRLDPQSAKRFADRLEEGFGILLDRNEETELSDQARCLAAVARRLDAAEARAMAERTVAGMEKQTGVALLLMSELLLAVEGQLDPPLRERAVQRLTLATQGRVNAVQLTALVRKLDQLHAPLTAEQRDGLTERIVKVVEKSEDAGSLYPLMSSVGPALEPLNADQARRIGERMLLVAENARTPVPAFDTLRAFAGKLAPDQSKRAIDLLLARIRTNPPSTASWIMGSFGPFASGLDPAQAATLFDRFLSAETNRAPDPIPILRTAARLPALAVRLDAERARAFAERLTTAIEATTESLAPGGLQRRLNPTEGLPAPAAFVSRSESMIDSVRIGGLCRALEALMPKLPKDQAGEFARRVALRLERQGWNAPLALDETTSAIPAVLQHAPPQALVDVLNTPFAVGGLRRAVLQAWGLKTARTFDSVRSFTAWAASAPEARDLQLVPRKIP
jgi:hypothetical protein